MIDLLTVEEDKQAAAEGWRVGYVYDLKTDRWTVQIFPLAFVKPFAFADAMAAHVVGLARMGHPIALKAVRFVANPVTRKGKNNV